VPLLAGGGLFETGAGGSAPKHVEQFLQENHLRWDSLGEYLALAVSYEHMALSTGHARAKVLGETLNDAVGLLLSNDKSPSRKAKEIDNRGASFYLALYWAQALAKKDAATFGALADALTAHEAAIAKELIDCQGKPVDIGGFVCVALRGGFFFILTKNIIQLLPARGRQGGRRPAPERHAQQDPRHGVNMCWGCFFSSLLLFVTSTPPLVFYTSTFSENP
jgi:hypothetical protein